MKFTNFISKLLNSNFNALSRNIKFQIYLTKQFHLAISFFFCFIGNLWSKNWNFKLSWNFKYDFLFESKYDLIFTVTFTFCTIKLWNSKLPIIFSDLKLWTHKPTKLFQTKVFFCQFFSIYRFFMQISDCIMKRNTWTLSFQQI